jgi:hypothetical protein
MFKKTVCAPRGQANTPRWEIGAPVGTTPCDPGRLRVFWTNAFSSRLSTSELMSGGALLAAASKCDDDFAVDVTACL